MWRQFADYLEQNGIALRMFREFSVGVLDDTAHDFLQGYGLAAVLRGKLTVSLREWVVGHVPGVCPAVRDRGTRMRSLDLKNTKTQPPERPRRRRRMIWKKTIRIL